MRKRGLDAATASDNENAVIGDKGCGSGSWIDEYRNQRCIDLLRWLIGRG